MNGVTAITARDRYYFFHAALMCMVSANLNRGEIFNLKVD